MIMARLDGQDRRMNDIYDLLKQQHENIRDLRTDVRRLDDKLDRVDQRVRGLEDKIDSIRVTWSTRLVGSILGTSAVTSGIVAYFVTSIS